MKSKCLESKINAIPSRSAWKSGVKLYALELLENIPDNYDASTAAGCADIRKALLNGARDWEQYSEGGCALIYDDDIAARLCSPSEYRKSRCGSRNPNSRESWIDVQARALYQAARLVMITAKEA